MYPFSYPKRDMCVSFWYILVSIEILTLYDVKNIPLTVDRVNFLSLRVLLSLTTGTVDS